MKFIIFSNNVDNLIQFRISLIKYLLKKKHKLFLIVLDKKKRIYNLNKYFEKVYYINFTTFKVFRLIKTIIKIKYLLDKIKPDLILSYTLEPNIISSILSYFKKHNFIINITGLGSYFISQNIFLKIILKTILKLSQNIIFQNKFDKNFFLTKKDLSKNYFIIPSLGIRSQKFFNKNKNKNKNKIKFLMISRIIRDKGLIEYSKATKYFSDKKNIKFYFAGEFEQKNPSKITKIDFFNILKNSNFIYLGFKKNVVNIMHNFDCIVLPSYREGLSKTILEAGSKGIPVITTDVPGCRDIIKNNINGILCKPASVKSLVKAIKYFINLSKQKKIEMSNKSIEIIDKKFNQEKVLEIYYKNIISVINKKK